MRYGRTVRYERQSRRVDGRFDALVGRELASRFFEDRTRPRTTVRPSVRTRDLDRAFTNVLRLVVRMRTRQVPHRQASTPRPPHVMFLTRPSPRLAIFIACYVARVGEGLGTRLGYTCRVYSAAHVLWIAQNAGGSSAMCQEVGSSRFELERTNIVTYKLFVLVA